MHRRHCIEPVRLSAPQAKVHITLHIYLDSNKALVKAILGYFIEMKVHRCKNIFNLNIKKTKKE